MKEKAKFNANGQIANKKDLLELFYQENFTNDVAKMLESAAEGINSEYRSLSSECTDSAESTEHEESTEQEDEYD